ncbi:MAG TPA: CHAT domain-containing tetratricopeptide repeat protein [Steroidobacteraceae bacterium]|nr:CHAT domain-containing tetratricopeptide repeat protein [Steroidobacteraceae bacterium]
MIRCNARHVLVCGLLGTAALSGCSREAPRLTAAISDRHIVDTEHPARVALNSDGTSAWLIEVDQRDLDVWIEVLDEQGSSVSASDSPSRRSGVESTLLQLPAGSFSVVVRSAEHPEKSAPIRIDAYSVSAAQQRSHSRWIEAALAETTAARAFRSMGAAAGQLALSSYVTAAQEWRGLGDTAREANAVFQEGWISYRLLDDPAGAARAGERAVALFQRAGDEAMAAQSMLLAALTTAEAPASASDGNAAAARLAAAARDIFARNGDAARVAEAIHAQAAIDHYAGNFLRARERFLDCEARFRQLGEPEGVRKCVANAAHMSYELGRFREAAETYDRVFAANAPESNPGMYADMLDNSAHARTIIGEFESALRQYAIALELHQRMDDRAGQARSLFGTGVTYQRIGDAARAVDYLERTTAMRRDLLRGALGGDNELITDLITLAGAYRETGRNQQARRALDEAMALSESSRDRSRVALATARYFAADREFAAAAKLLRGIVADTAGNNAALTLQATLDLGRIQTELGDYGAALATLQHARTEFAGQGAPIFEAETLYWMAQAYRRSGNATLSLEHTRAALSIAERIRASATNPDFRSRFLAARRAMYDLQVNLLLDRYGRAADSQEREILLSQALRASDQSRARTLSDLIAAGRSDRASSDDRQLHRLATDIATREYQLERLRDQAAQASQVEAVKRDIVELRSQFDLALSRLPARESPGATLAAPRTPVDLPADAVTLVYFLSEERSFLWIASAQGLQGVELPGKASIASAVAALRRSIARLDANAERGAALAVASQLLLPPGPALSTASTWIVVPDSFIHHVPFAALLAPQREASQARVRFVVEHHSIVLAPTYAAAMRIAHDRGTLTLSSSGPAVIFGDPVYSPGDARFGSLQPAARGLLPVQARLAGTTRELERIAMHLRETRPVILSGFDATREAALSEATLRAALIHFAAHATFDARNPARTGIELAALTRDGRTLQNLLTPMDLSTTRMQASLVVLSACESALGEEIDGEGPIGLSYGFLAAGSRAVVATQWRVADAATAELMDRFYAHASSGKRPLHEALRDAQLDLLRASRWRSPLFWAGTSITATR